MEVFIICCKMRTRMCKLPVLKRVVLFVVLCLFSFVLALLPDLQLSIRTKSSIQYEYNYFNVNTRANGSI